jgi:hypothetical protein
MVRCVIYAEKHMPQGISQRASFGDVLIIHGINGEIGRRMALYLGSILMTLALPSQTRDSYISMD